MYTKLFLNLILIHILAHVRIYISKCMTNCHQILDDTFRNILVAYCMAQLI